MIQILLQYAFSPMNAKMFHQGGRDLFLILDSHHFHRHIHNIHTHNYSTHFISLSLYFPIVLSFEYVNNYCYSSDLHHSYNPLFSDILLLLNLQRQLCPLNHFHELINYYLCVQVDYLLSYLRSLVLHHLYSHKFFLLLFLEFCIIQLDNFQELLNTANSLFLSMVMVQANFKNLRPFLEFKYIS